jgi:hypothetical protein
MILLVETMRSQTDPVLSEVQAFTVVSKAHARVLAASAPLGTHLERMKVSLLAQSRFGLLFPGMLLIPALMALLCGWAWSGLQFKLRQSRQDQPENPERRIEYTPMSKTPYKEFNAARSSELVRTSDIRKGSLLG